MFHHVKDLQFNARVSAPDPRFATILLEQFGGANGELAASMQYFQQAFGVKVPYPDKYDMLMDIATEELSHLEIVGATIQMLLKGINGDLKNAAEESELMQVMGGRPAKENLIQEGITNPQFFVLSGGGPALVNSQGIPWCASYTDSNGDLTVDLRSNIAAESRAKLVYEYLMQFTDDPYVKDTLKFLMTREIAHFEMFQAALETIQPNYPPGVLQADPRFTNQYFNMSNTNNVRGPWNEGEMPITGQQWDYVENPVAHINGTKGLSVQSPEMEAFVEQTEEINWEVSQLKREEATRNEPDGVAQWSTYSSEKYPVK